MKNSNSKDIIEKIAEYLSLASTLELSIGKDLYRRANQLSLELAMFVSADLYRHIVRAVDSPSNECNPFTAAIAARTWLGVQGENGILTPNELAGHFPGAKDKMKGKRGRH